VAVASLLNATLVIPEFLYSNVWKDPRYGAFGTKVKTELFTCTGFVYLFLYSKSIHLFAPVDLNVNDEMIINKQLRNVISVVQWFPQFAVRFDVIHLHSLYVISIE